MLKKIFTGFLVSLLCFFGFNPHSEAQENNAVILATTTSVQDTGLLDILVEAFQKKSGITVKAVAVGTGQALQLGRQGEADILWVHSPDDEKQFVEEGYGINRITFMHNDFVLLGPENDPAGVKGTANIIEAFKKINQAKVLFVSRGDKSGTHNKELKLWKEAGITPEKERYLETGQSMAQTAQVANEKQAYSLVDRSTYLSLKKSLNLIIVSQGDEKLRNNYSLILVNPEKFPKVNAKGAKVFFDYLLSKETKEIVEAYGKEKFGQQLFFYDY
jgi:tungstate transport system substrate-binding protein